MRSTRVSCLAIASLAGAVLAIVTYAAHAQGVPDYGFEWAVIDHPGNIGYNGPDENQLVTGRGSVDYTYRIAKTEVRSSQWLEFINTFSNYARPHPQWSLFPAGYWGAAIDTSFPGPGQRWQLVNNTTAGDAPVFGTTWRMSALYCNWLQNGKSADPASLVSGAYDTTTWGDGEDEFGNAIALDAPGRMPGAQYFIPTFDEWFKAVHFDPNRYGLEQPGWWYGPTSSDTLPIPGAPGVGQTSTDWSSDLARDLPLGSYTNVTSPWGLWDTSGGGREWCEDLVQGRYRRYDGSEAGLPDWYGIDRADSIGDEIYWAPSASLRIAGVVPSPGVAVIVYVYGLSISILRRRNKCVFSLLHSQG